MKNNTPDIVGLVPAAGFATRVASLLDCSKEIYPITLADGSSRVVSSFLMESLKYANAHKSYIILRSGKWDIPEYFSNGYQSEMKLAYIVSEPTSGVPFTIDKAFPFIKGSTVLLGFPDIIFRPKNAYQKLLIQQQDSQSDLVLGLFKTSKTEKADMVKFDGVGNLKDIIIKPEQTHLVYTWIMAAWSPLFTYFLHDYLTNKTSGRSDENNPTDSGELHIGEVVRDAIKAGIKTSYVTFDEGCFLDIGTPEDLNKAADIQLVDQL
jgi:glucose-1-phosphate thymidylyltransferase